MSRIQIYLWTDELAARGAKKMEKKNVLFTKDGMKVGVKEVKDEVYADRTQRYEWPPFYGPSITRDILGILEENFLRILYMMLICGIQGLRQSMGLCERG